MFQFISKVLRFIGLEYDPSTALDWSKEKKPKGKPIEIADDIRIGLNGLEKVSQDDEGVMTWQRVSTTKEAKKTNEITDIERDILLENGMDLVKAQEIKIVWATGVSYHDAAKIINKDGFSPRSIQPFWKIFNSCAK